MDNGRIHRSGLVQCPDKSGPGLGCRQRAPKYADPTAILTGSWGANQSVQAKAHVISPSYRYYQEIELRLRSKLSAHAATGYEINFGVSHAYVEIVRWNGALGNFTYLGSSCRYPAVCGQVSGFTIRDGDVAKATIIGDKILVYVNEKLIASATDSTFSTGNPGIGFNYGCDSTYGTHGWSSFSATDELADLSPLFVIQ